MAGSISQRKARRVLNSGRRSAKTGRRSNRTIARVSVYSTPALRVGVYRCPPGDALWHETNDNIGARPHVVFPGTAVGLGGRYAEGDQLSGFAFEMLGEFAGIGVDDPAVRVPGFLPVRRCVPGAVRTRSDTQSPRLGGTLCPAR